MLHNLYVIIENATHTRTDLEFDKNIKYAESVIKKITRNGFINLLLYSIKYSNGKNERKYAYAPIVLGFIA
jgi:hypothetical protein